MTSAWIVCALLHSPQHPARLRGDRDTAVGGNAGDRQHENQLLDFFHGQFQFFGDVGLGHAVFARSAYIRRSRGSIVTFSRYIFIFTVLLYIVAA